MTVGNTGVGVPRIEGEPRSPPPSFFPHQTGQAQSDALPVKDHALKFQPPRPARNAVSRPKSDLLKALGLAVLCRCAVSLCMTPCRCAHHGCHRSLTRPLPGDSVLDYETSAIHASVS